MNTNKNNQEIVILVADDDEGHTGLICRNLKRSGISNTILQFKDGQEVIDFLFKNGTGPHREEGLAYILLLDIRMPKINGVEVLKKIKEDQELKIIPVIMVTTTDDPKEIELCHKIGCSTYITKPVEYDHFVEAIRQLGLFLKIVQIPKMNGNYTD